MSFTPEQLTWLIPLPPLVAFGLIVLVTNRSKALSHTIAIGLMALSWVMSWIVFGTTLGIEHFGAEDAVITSSVPWLPFGNAALGTRPLSMGVLVDPLTGAMLFFVPLACLLIFIYSAGYSNFGKPRDPHDRPGNPPHGVEPLYSRFFAYLSLFAFGMLVLVVADNLLLMFVGWEIMGLCSYLLIGFWFARNYPNPRQITPRQAAIKAFMTTRVGDMFMLLGIAYLYAQTGTLSFRELFTGAAGGTALVSQLAQQPSVIVGLSTAALAGILLFIGTVGKSAQFPLHVWLPDAMEGPTPVSAMIHAATMVSAGVYAMIRIFPLLAAGWTEGAALTPAMLAVATIGSISALGAATVAVAQSDIKKVMAYSTISQLGFMLAALGIGAYVAATFHLVMHAFFKALLFLASGSVIHGMEHGHHHVSHAAHASETAGHEHGGDKAVVFDPQNMYNMGGLARRMPVTFWTTVAGGLSLAGFPLVTAGFWSKDEILADAWLHAQPVFWVLAIAALLTAFYTMRLISLTFLGEPRTPAAEHATEKDPIFRPMLLALVVLAFFAIVGGWVGIPESFPVIGPLVNRNWFHSYVGVMVEAPEAAPAGEVPAGEVPAGEVAAGEHGPAEAFDPVPLITSLVVALGGLTLGWWTYRRYRKGQVDPTEAALGPLWAPLRDKYYFDEIYDTLFVKPAYWVSEQLVSETIDRGIIDGTLHAIGRGAIRLGRAFRDYFDTPVVNGGGDLVGEGVKRFGHSFRVIQTGRIQQYMLVVMAVMVVLGVVLLWPGLGQ